MQLDQSPNTSSVAYDQYLPLCDDIPMGYITLDDTGKIISLNRAAAELLKQEKQNIINTLFIHYIVDNDQPLFRQHFQRIQQNKQSQSLELEIASMDSHVITAKTTITTLSKTPLYQIILDDISEQKVLLHELQLAKQQADLANKAKSQFLAVMSHEIRTPLNVIVGYSELLAEQSDELALSKNFTNDLEAIQSAGNHLAELINNILDISKIEANKLNIMLEPMELKLLIHTVYNLNKEAADAKQLTFRYDFMQDLPDVIISDRIRLTQILTNLINNAIKFTPIGKEISLEVGYHDDILCFVVEDQGVGIPKEKQSTIFDVFKQVDMSSTRYFGGTGLGLALVKELVELLDGELLLQSELQKGTIFTVKIPLVLPENMDNFTLVSKRDHPFSPDNKILLVEDNPSNRGLIHAQFDNLGLTLDAVENGQACLEYLQLFNQQACPLDLIIMDLHMPLMNGIETVKHIRNNLSCKEVPIIMISADVYDEQKMAAREVGCSDFLTKPLNLKQIMPVLSKYLR